MITNFFSRIKYELKIKKTLFRTLDMLKRCIGNRYSKNS